MFLPIGDSPNPSGTPWVTTLLLGVNVAVFLACIPLQRQRPDVTDPAFGRYVGVLVAEGRVPPEAMRQFVGTVSRYDLVVFDHGFRPAAPQWLDLLTAMFLHGGWMHLAGNMLFLWIYGDNVEARLGRVGFLAAYLLTGVAGSAGDWLLRMGSDVPSLGASGAISGVLGFYFLWFPHNRVRVWVFFFPLIARVILLPARLVLGAYVVLDNILPVLLAGGGGGVSHGAHLGGFVAGCVGAFVLQRRDQHPFEARDRRTAVADAPPPPQHADHGLAAWRADLAAERWVAAGRRYFTLPPAVTRAVGPSEKLHLAERLAQVDQPRAALALFQRCLGEHPRGPGRARAHLGAARLLMDVMDYPTAAYQHLYSALEAGPSATERAEAQGLLERLSSRLRRMPRDR